MVRSLEGKTSRYTATVPRLFSPEDRRLGGGKAISRSPQRSTMCGLEHFQEYGIHSFSEQFFSYPTTLIVKTFLLTSILKLPSLILKPLLFILSVRAQVSQFILMSFP